MTRSDLLAYLSETYREITETLSIAQADAPSAYSLALDQAFRRLGVAESGLSTATTESVEAAQALGEYYSLRRFRALAAVRVDYPADGNRVMQKRSQLFQQITDLLVEAAERCEALGFSMKAETLLQSVQWSTDYVEPVALDG